MNSAACFGIVALLLFHEVHGQFLDSECEKYTPDKYRFAPWMALIVSNQQSCTGTLVNKHYVLTVASCVLNQNQIIVRFGSNKDYYVKEVYIPNLYNKNDIALVKLIDPVLHIKPICILLNDGLKLESNSNFKATNWGASGSTITKSINKFENKKCSNSFGVYPDHTQICAGYSNIDKCAERGSPLVVEKFTNYYTLVGIQSYGNLGTCLYTNIIRYFDWIVGVVLEVDVILNT